jgi:hypothetical protein
LTKATKCPTKSQFCGTNTIAALGVSSLARELLFSGGNFFDSVALVAPFACRFVERLWPKLGLYPEAFSNNILKDIFS